jgi:DNA-binding IscR family transcriptional regulator
LLGDRPCDLAKPCDAHDRWVDVKARVMAPLRATTIAELVAERVDP